MAVPMQIDQCVYIKVTSRLPYIATESYVCELWFGDSVLFFLFFALTKKPTNIKVMTSVTVVTSIQPVTIIM